MGFQDFTSSAVLTLVTFCFEIYSNLAKIILLAFYPITRSIMLKKMKSFGVEPNGPKPWDIQIHNEREFFTKVAIGSLSGLFQSRVDKDWSTKDFVELISRLATSNRAAEGRHPLLWFLENLNLQTKAKAWEVVQTHYDTGDEIIQIMLGKHLQYTSGYFAYTSNHDEAQFAKMELVAKKLHLQPGMTVLDMGCGYGTLAQHLARNYHVSVVGISLSKEQLKHARNICQGLNCKFMLTDYRDFDGQFDRVVSMELFEHVGKRNYRTFFEVARRCLKDDGIFLMQTTGRTDKAIMGSCYWAHNNVLPNIYVPHMSEVYKGFEGLWVMEDWHNFGDDYFKTFQAWEKNVDKKWHDIGHKYPPDHQLVWKTYFQLCQAAFKSRVYHVWQIALSKTGIKGGYISQR